MTTSVQRLLVRRDDLATTWIVARPRVIGMTSPRHVDYARSLGCYDDVVPYGAMPKLPRRRTVYVDFAGDAGLRRLVHAHFQDDLA